MLALPEEREDWFTHIGTSKKRKNTPNFKMFLQPLINLSKAEYYYLAQFKCKNNILALLKVL